MEENKRTELDKINEKKEIMTPKDYRSIFWRSFTIQGSWSFDKMMAYGYMYAIEKPLRKIYPNDDDFLCSVEKTYRNIQCNSTCFSVPYDTWRGNGRRKCKIRNF